MFASPLQNYEASNVEHMWKMGLQWSPLIQVFWSITILKGSVSKCCPFCPVSMYLPLKFLYYWIYGSLIRDNVHVSLKPLTSIGCSIDLAFGGEPKIFWKFKYQDENLIFVGSWLLHCLWHWPLKIIALMESLSIF